MWGEFIDLLQENLTEHSDFDSLSSLEEAPIPNDVDLPYTALPSLSTESWMTLSQASAGEDIPLRMVTVTDIRSGGMDKSKEITKEIRKALNLRRMEGDSIVVEGCRVTSQTKPFRVDADSSEFNQIIDFQIHLVYKEGSEYYS